MVDWHNANRTYTILLNPSFSFTFHFSSIRSSSCRCSPLDVLWSSSPSSKRSLARGKTSSSTLTAHCCRNRQNRMVRFLKPDIPVSIVSSRSFQLTIRSGCQQWHIFKNWATLKKSCWFRTTTLSNEHYELQSSDFVASALFLVFNICCMSIDNITYFISRIVWMYHMRGFNRSLFGTSCRSYIVLMVCLSVEDKLSYKK
jgi:hypothetical protein